MIQRGKMYNEAKKGEEGNVQQVRLKILNMKYIIILAIMCIVLQVEVLGIVFLERQNLKIWSAQADLNESIINLCESKN